MYLRRIVGVTIAVVMGLGTTALAEETTPEPELVLFDTIWKDFHLRPKMEKEVQEHVMKWIRKAGGFTIVDRGKRDRTIMEKRIFVMGEPDLAKAEEIAAQAGWKYFLHSTYQGVPGKGVKITFVFRDMTRGKDGVIVEEKLVRNHLKAIRNTARALAFKAVSKGLEAMRAGGGSGKAPAE